MSKKNLNDQRIDINELRILRIHFSHEGATFKMNIECKSHFKF